MATPAAPDQAMQDAIAKGPTSPPAPTIIDKAKAVATQATTMVQH